MKSPAQVTLILLPGMDGTGEFFDSFIQALNPAIRTVIVRYPKTGSFSYEALTALASEQIAAANIPADAPYMLLGESFSGPIAIALAAKANPQLKGLVLSCTFAANPRPLLSKFSFLVPAITFNSFWLALTSKFLMGNFKDEKMYQQLCVTLPAIAPITMRSRLDAVIGVDYSEILAKINAPILYLRGRHDYLVPTAASQQILKLAKSVTLVELEAPHMLLQLAPKAAATALQSFMEKVTR